MYPCTQHGPGKPLISSLVFDAILRSLTSDFGSSLQGKSFSTIALLHTVMTHPDMVSDLDDNKGGPLIRTVLLVVPVNTIANWENGECFR